MTVILFLFLTHLGLGIIFSLAVVSREAGVKFFRFNAGLAAILIAVAFVFRSIEQEQAADRVACQALLIAQAAIVLYSATVGRPLARFRPIILGTACVAGLIALLAQSIAAAAGSALTAKGLTAASFLSSTALLGGACTAMILGHWYLIIPSLQVAHLQHIVKIHIA